MPGDYDGGLTWARVKGMARRGLAWAGRLLQRDRPRFLVQMAVGRIVPFPKVLLGEDDETDVGYAVPGVLVRKVFLENIVKKPLSQDVFCF